MTDAQIIAEFLRIEAFEKKRPQGPDYGHILRTVAAMSERPLADVRRLILDTTFSQPN